MMRRYLSDARLHVLFQISIVLKGLDGVLETVGGLALLVIRRSDLDRLFVALTQHELSEDPHDLVANFLMNLATHLSSDVKMFAAVYLLAHGVIKAVLVGALLKNRTWAYPAAIAFLWVFVSYQVYRCLLVFSWGMVFLTLFDLCVLALVWHEYRYLKRRIHTA
jgi:uncharacterized membrane protein